MHQISLPLAGKYPAVPKLRRLSVRETPAFRASTTPYACTTLELLAALVGGPQQIEIAERLLAHFQNDMRRLFNAPVEEISGLPGLGTATAARIKAALAMSVHLAAPCERRSITSPADAAALVQAEMSLLEQEHLRVILLDTRNRVLDIVEICRGSVNSAQVRIAEVFRPAIQRNATAILVLHNHPSGDASPSPDDAAITRVILQAGKLLDVSVLDHLVIGHNSWVSMKERGLGFS